MNCDQGDGKKNTRVRLRMNQKDPFPEKLYDVANDGYLVKWNGCGTGVQVEDADLFENEVMNCYPGFLQIATFANFRRLFREYSFNWKLLDDDCTLEFSHPCFVYGYRDDVSEVRTRKKSFSKPSMGMSTFQRDVLALNDDAVADESKRYRTRSRLTKRRSRELEDSLDSSSDSNNSTFVINDSLQDSSSMNNDSYKYHDLNAESVINVPSPRDTSNGRRTFSSVASQIMKLFVKNEFTFEDFCTWAERNQRDFGLDANKFDIFSYMNNQPEIIAHSYSEFVDNSVSYQPIEQSFTQELQEYPEQPCKNCACCRAYQNLHCHQSSTLQSENVRRNLFLPGELDLSCEVIQERENGQYVYLA